MPRDILYSSIKSALFRRSSRVHSFNFFNLSMQLSDLSSGNNLVKRCCTFSKRALSWSDGMTITNYIERDSRQNNRALVFRKVVCSGLVFRILQFLKSQVLTNACQAQKFLPASTMKISQSLNSPCHIVQPAVDCRYNTVSEQKETIGTQRTDF